MEVQCSIVTMFAPVLHAFYLLKIIGYDQPSAKEFCDFAA
jgi:hypothetical protein